VESVTVPGIDLIVAVGPGPQHLDRLPAGTRVAVGVPFHLLLPYCDAVVHHGGAGTALTAVVSGVPQVVIPQSPPYAEIAVRVERCGVGVVVNPEDGAAAVRDALVKTLDDERCRRSIETVRAQITAQPAPAEVAARLLAATPA
jgi:glycosyltransferase